MPGAPFLVSFSQLTAVKKPTIFGAARKIFGPSYFVTVLRNNSVAATVAVLPVNTKNHKFTTLRMDLTPLCFSLEELEKEGMCFCRKSITNLLTTALLCYCRGRH